MTRKNKEETAVVPEDKNTGIVVFDYGDDEGRGFEHQSKADTSIPFIKQCQALTPAVVEEKARPGDYIHTLTGDVYSRDVGFLFVPGTTRHMIAEWVPRDLGGGFRGHHDLESDVWLDAIKRGPAIDPKTGKPRYGKYKTADGVNDLTETFYVYGVLCSEEGYALSMAVLSFWSTKIRPYRAWMYRVKTPINVGAKLVRPPLYANLTRITSKLDKRGNDQFYVPVIQSGDPRGSKQSLLAPDDERFQMAKTCAQLVDSGDAEVKYEQSRDGDDDGGGDAEGDGQPRVGKDGLPF